MPNDQILEQVLEQVLSIINDPDITEKEKALRVVDLLSQYPRAYAYISNRLDVTKYVGNAWAPL